MHCLERFLLPLSITVAAALAQGTKADYDRALSRAQRTDNNVFRTKVGTFGGSAGGQNALAGLLHHGDFYKVGVADCGCHDNRMDKIWWNEAWLGETGP